MTLAMQEISSCRLSAVARRSDTLVGVAANGPRASFSEAEREATLREKPNMDAINLWRQ